MEKAAEEHLFVSLFFLLTLEICDLLLRPFFNIFFFPGANEISDERPSESRKRIDQQLEALVCGIPETWVQVFFALIFAHFLFVE